MRRRKLVVLAASAAFLVILLLQNPPGELRRRIAVLARAPSRGLAVRRLEGSGSAFDRRYFFFLESARRRLPPGVRGVAIFTPRPTPEALYLASYHLAPVPVLLAPRQVPPRWIAAVYGPAMRPPGWRVLAPVSDGALMLPP